MAMGYPNPHIAVPGLAAYSAAKHGSVTRSGHGVAAQEPAARRAAATASATSAGVAECTRHRTTEVSTGLRTSKVSPVVRLSPSTQTARVLPNQDRYRPVRAFPRFVSENGIKIIFKVGVLIKIGCCSGWFAD
jgi:hypothetical protein